MSREHIIRDLRKLVELYVYELPETENDNLDFIDYVDKLSFAIDIDSEYGTYLTDEEVTKCKTLNDFVDVIEQQVGI